MAGRRPERRLATVLFLDIVDSTRIASEVGDRRWRDLLGEFRRIVRRDVRAQHGHEQDTAGDGFFVTFARPANAVHAAARIVRDVQPLGLDVRCGVHAGELERIGRGLGGIGAHIGARVMAQAGPAEVLVTGTVHDLVVGSGISFAPMADTELKGVPGRWTLYRVADVDGVALPRPLGPRALNARLGDQRREAAVPPLAVALAAVTVIIAAAMGAYALVPRAPASLGSAPSPSGGYPITMLGIDPETNEIVDRVRDSHLSIGRPSPVFVVDGTLWQETPVALVRRNLNTGVVEETMKLPENTWAVFFA
ncbi:MAG TPA: adenylate/guanylate cyclase domain-containing protein, partial [Candidatus Limnocylindria bacterium]|nr:adenylate/guanylate cyclase domain-containing protein [Candidatus Limnocylindria bacterium]